MPQGGAIFNPVNTDNNLIILQPINIDNNLSISLVARLSFPANLIRGAGWNKFKASGANM